ncbi:MAG: hypothetical protein LBS69_01440 [Prevotellaceae bacterium]|jgi:hypothetical protein|nr:hypothetical protein [Prevotellaceae bacterium]
MRTKLNTFWHFTQSLYPHELDYLMSVQNFKKEINLKILKQIYNNCHSDHPPLLFDTSIDKRAYSYVKEWIINSLEKIDVDVFFEWLIMMDKKVLTDIISPSDEAEILSYMKIIKPTHYYFVRFYELLQYYRDYLLVRNRTKYNALIASYLDTYEKYYLKSVEINKELHLITANIVKRDTDKYRQEIENILRQIYFDEELDGYTRYRAIVRLTIFFYNYRQFDKQLVMYRHLDELCKTPLFYSKRLLANYYANRAMMHSKLNELALAEKYAYLSIQNNNSDYLFYLINLCSVLVKQGKNKEVYHLMQESLPQLKNTNNTYYKIGFVSFYIKTLLVNHQYKKAVDYADNYFNAYKKDILLHRWHLFFCSYLQALILSEKYLQILSLCRRYNLITKENHRINRADYMPIILLYSLLSEYMENIIDKDKLINSIVHATKLLMRDKYRSYKIMELLDEISELVPIEIKVVKKTLLSYLE